MFFIYFIQLHEILKQFLWHLLFSYVQRKRHWNSHHTVNRCPPILSHTVSQKQAHKQPCAYLDQCLIHSHPSTVHDELLFKLVACKIKNIKQSAGSTIITLKGSFKHNLCIYQWITVFHTSKVVSCCCIAIFFISCMLILQVSHLLEPILSLVCLWFDRHADIKTDWQV